MRLITLRRSEGATLRLVALHHAGGGSNSFARWRAADLPGTEVIAAELPGRGSQLAHPPFTDWRSAVSALDGVMSELVPMPTIVFGHSMGALLAFELARSEGAVRRHNLQHVVVSGHAWPLSHGQRRALHMLSDEALLREIGALDGIAGELLEHRELIELLIPTLRADLTLVECYSYRLGPSVTCPFSAWGGRSDPIVSEADLRGWAAAAAESFDVQLFEGGHFYCEESNQAVCLALQRLVCAVHRKVV